MLIRVKNLTLHTNLGIHDWEQNFNRKIVINAEIESDFNLSLESDDINDTINYEIITTNIKNLIETKRFNLIEKMTQEIMNVIMSDQRIKRCKLEVDKVGVIDSVESFSIVIEKTRQNGS
jgi:FolB domain-containing protein